MPANMIESITVAKKGAEAASKKGLSSKGRVINAGESYDGKHATVTIAHGARKKPKKGDGMFVGDSRPTSTICLSKKHAKMFGVGSSVRLVIMPDDADADEDDEY
jgi:hypothetical protein